MNPTETHRARDAVAARSQSIRLRSKLKKGIPYNPTPLQAWRQAADDVAFNRPVKEKLVKLRSANSASALGNGVFSYGNLSLSEFEVRIISNSLRRAISLSVYRAPLVDLDLTRCDLDVKKAGFLGRGLAGNTTIERLTLRCNDLTADGAELIIRGILDSFSLLNSTDEYDEWGRRLDRGRGSYAGADVAQKRSMSEDAKRQRDLDAQRRAAQVSPFIDETARHLVSGIGYAPVTPAGPDGAIPIRGLTAGGAIPASSHNNFIHHPGSSSDQIPIADILTHTQNVFAAKLDPFSSNDQLRNAARAEGGSSSAAQILAKSIRPGSSGIVSFQALQAKSGLTREELLGKSDQYFEKYLQHEAHAQLTGIPVALGGGESLTQSSIESLDPTDPNIAKRQPFLHNPLNMYGPGGDLVPSGIYPNGLPDHPQVPLSSEQVEEPVKSLPPLPPIEDDEEGPGIAYRPEFPEIPRLHPLKYLNLVSTLLTIGCDRIDTALDIKQIGSSDSRALNALADLVSHPLCGLKNLNISKNRLDARCCEKLWVCLDLNKTLDVIGMHNTQAGPVVAAGFVAKALGLSIAHGRAALTDERLGVIWAPTKNGFESTLDRKAVEETTLGYFQGLSMGAGGKWDQKVAEKKRTAEKLSQVAQPTLKEKNKMMNDTEKLLFDAKSVFQEHSTLVVDNTSVWNRSDIFQIPLQSHHERISLAEQASVSGSVMPGPSSILGWRSFSSISEYPHRHGYDEEGRNVGKSVSSVFWERVRGIVKLNLSTCALGDVGVLGLSALLMAARRSDEVMSGRLRQKQKISTESMRRWRESGGTEAGFLAAASKAAGVSGDARSINRVPLNSSKRSGMAADYQTEVDVSFGLSSISSENASSGDIAGTLLAAGSALAFAKQKNKFSDTSKKDDPGTALSLSASGGPLLSFAGGADEDAEKLSAPSAAGPGLTGLEWLKLRSNEIGPKAISILCRSLRTSLSLRILDLSHNPIGVLGAHSLADALAHPHCTLQELIIDSCKITHAGEDLSGAHALLRSLYVNRTITRLSMKANTLVPQELKFARGWEHQGITYSLKQLFGENRTLQVLDLRDNYIHKAGQMACADAVSLFPYIVPHATVVASILTRWLDEHLTRFHSRPPPGANSVTLMTDSFSRLGIKSKSSATSKNVDISSLDRSQTMKPHFPTVEELLMRPPSTAPVASIYAALDTDEAIAAVREADKRNHREKVELDALRDNTKLRHESRKMKKRKKKEAEQANLPDASVLLHAVQMAHQAERHETTFPNVNDSGSTRNGTATSIASEQQRQREEREVAAIAAAVSAAFPKRDPEVQKIIALGNLLAASKSGIGASQRALEFLQQSEPVWVKDHQEFVKQMNEEKERKQQANQSKHDFESDAASSSQRVISTAASISTSSDGKPNNRGMFGSTPMSLIFGGGKGDGGSERAVSREGTSPTSAPLEAPKLKLKYPRVVLRGSTDNAEGRALARIIRDTTSRQISRKSQGTALSLMSGLGSISSSLSDTFASAGNMLSSSNGNDDNDTDHVEDVISQDGFNESSIINTSINSAEKRQRSSSSPSSSRKGKKSEASPEALSAINKFVNDKVIPVADRDYVIVRGSRLSLEVAIPKLDFTRLSYYGGISPQNAFFDAQNGKDDVIDAFQVRFNKLGIPPPFALPKTSKLLANDNHDHLDAPRFEEANKVVDIDVRSSESDFSLAAPRGALRRQASLREILSMTSKVSRKKAGHDFDGESDDEDEEGSRFKSKSKNEDEEIDGFEALEGAPPKLSEIFAASLREKEEALKKQRSENEAAEIVRQKEITRQRAIRKDAQRRKQKENHEKLRNARLGRFPPPSSVPVSVSYTSNREESQLSSSSSNFNVDSPNLKIVKGAFDLDVVVPISNTAEASDIIHEQKDSLRPSILFEPHSSSNFSSKGPFGHVKEKIVSGAADSVLSDKTANMDNENSIIVDTHRSTSSSDSEISNVIIDRVTSQPSLRYLALNLPSKQPSLSPKAEEFQSSAHRKIADDGNEIILSTSKSPLSTNVQSDSNEDRFIKENTHTSDGFITASENSDASKSNRESDTDWSQSRSRFLNFIQNKVTIDESKPTSTITTKKTLHPHSDIPLETPLPPHPLSIIRAGKVLDGSRNRLDKMIAPKVVEDNKYDSIKSISSDSDNNCNSSMNETSDHSSSEVIPQVAIASSVSDPRIDYEPISADGSRRIVDSRGLIPIDIRNLTSIPKYTSENETSDSDVSSSKVDIRTLKVKKSPSYARSKLRPGQYTKMDLTITTRKMVTPANAVPLISMRRGEMLRDTLATGVSSLIHLRGNVIRLVFDFLGEERKVLC